MTDAANNPSSGQRDRSPAFPSIPLEAALRRLVEFEAHYKRSGARPERIGDAWGIKGKAYVDRTAAALKYFGLLEYQGTGTARQIVISEEGRKYLRAQQEETKRDVVRAAALRPKQIFYFWSLWGSDRPADAACIDELTLKNGFSDSGARDFLGVYDATISFARLPDSDKSGTDREVANDADDADDEQQEPVVQSRQQTPSLPSQLTPAMPPPLGKPRIVMTGDHLDIHASVDLEGLRRLQTMLKKYEEILELMEPNKEKAAN
jgi:hypothetical protein